MNPVETEREPTSAAPAVLVVDDEEWVAEASRALLEDLGYQVDVAFYGRDALTLHETRAYTFVLLDLRLPGMDGPEVLRRMLARDPTTRIILSSGYLREQVDPSLFGQGAVGFLGKPFELHELLAQIRTVGAPPPPLPGS